MEILHPTYFTSLLTYTVHLTELKDGPTPQLIYHLCTTGPQSELSHKVEPFLH